MSEETKPSEIIKKKIEKKGGELRSRQIEAVVEYLDELAIKVKALEGQLEEITHIKTP